MKFFTLPAILAAAVLSAVCVMPFLPVASRPSHEKSFFVELKLSSDHEGVVQMFYDDGLGFRENSSERASLPVGSTAGVVQLRINAGKYRQFRFDPTNGIGKITVESIHVVDWEGQVIHRLPLEDFTTENQIQSAQLMPRGLEIITLPTATDPQLIIQFSPPLNIRVPWHRNIQGWVSRAATLFSVSIILLFLLDRLPRVRQLIRSSVERAWQKPVRAVLLVAAISVTVSSYPIVFLGKSFISPNLGTALLYDSAVALPGYQDTRVSDVKGSDIGAIIWSHVPLSMMQRDALLHGELPLWNRYNSTGTPLLGQGQSMVGDPLTFLVALADGASWAWDLKYLMSKWLFAAGLALCVFVVTRNLGAASLIAASAPFIGFFLYRVNHPANFSVSYAPWVLLCWLHISQAQEKRRAYLWILWLLVANAVLLNSGTVKEAYMLLLTLNLTGFICLLIGADEWKSKLNKIGFLIWAGILFILLLAPVWLNFLDSLSKAYTSYNARSAFQIQPGLLLGVFDELFFRPLTVGERVFNPSANCFILAGCLYFFATLRIQLDRRLAAGLALGTILPMALVFGVISPKWIGNMPFLGNVAHIDNSFSCGLIIIWCILAGVGFDTAAARLRTKDAGKDLVVSLLLLLAIVASYIGFGQAAHRATFGPGTTFSGISAGQPLPLSGFVWWSLLFIIVALLGFGLLAWRSIKNQRTSPAAGILMVLSFLVLHWRFAQHHRAVGFDTYTFEPTVRVDLHAPSLAIDIMRSAQRVEPSRGIGLDGNFFPGWSGVYDLEGVSGPDALINPRYRELCGVAPIDRIWDWRIFLNREGVARARPFLDMLNVRYYFATRNDPVVAPNVKLVRKADLDVYESTSCWPRAFFTDRVGRVESAQELIQKISTGDGRPFATIHGKDVVHSGLADISGDLTARKVAPATRYELTPNTTSFEIRASGKGVAVLTEAWSPRDFRAEINGRAAPVVRINHAFKGVVIPGSGDYRVKISYVPEQYRLSMALGLSGLFLAAATVFFVWRLPDKIRSPRNATQVAA
jgi:hypothetical protein